MIYPRNFESKTGFDAVRRMVADRCGSPLSAAKADDMTFSSDFDTVSRRLGEVAEFVTVLGGSEDFPAAVIRDITARLRALRPDGTFLTAAELIDLGTSLSSMAAIEAFFRSKRTDEGTSELPLLDDLARRLTIFPTLSTLIGNTVDRWGEVKDTASPTLADIRRRLRSMGGSINSVMRRVIANAVNEGLIEPDTTASVRDGRLVLPVPPMHKRRIPGIVHDESASGKTIFIEPAEVVEANNRLRELHIEEHREVVRILIGVADTLRPHIDTLLDSYDILATFDFIRAKAVFAVDCEASMPHLVGRHELEWYHACHPVLRDSLARQQKTIVPLDITLTADDGRILVISGPNAGGKSVTLKTVAVVQYMLQCGLLPPVYENSHCGIFEDIFIDIGDDQSIEDDLSTYSSHLRNMRQFLRGNDRTLILIDEFGAGTEPQIGGAIAQALLAEFNNRRMWGVVTTHFQNLKKFAEETAGLVNGSMLYDRQAMRPLFQLAVGHPGSSFAIEIARKIGLPESIIAAAGEIVGSDYVNLDKYLLDIARDRRYWENKRQQIKLKERRIDEVLTRYEDDADNLRRRRNEIIADAREEARKILDGSNAAIERTIHDIKRAQAEREATLDARRRLADDKRTLAAATAEHPLIAGIKPRRNKAKDKQPAEQPVRKKALAVGDNVLLDNAGTPGTVEEIRGKEAVVVFGQMRTVVKLSRLTPTLRRPASGAAKAASFVSASTADESRERQLRFKPDIDVRGMRVDEALQAVTYFIDDAIQFNSSRVRILHGTGTGALRQSIRDYLATIPAVRRFADEDVRLGGAGITVIEF